MFRKIKDKLKLKLKNWLEIAELQKSFNQYTRENDRNILCHKHNINELQKSLNLNQEQIDALNRTLKSVVSVGADITRDNYDRNSSWAVVCIENGKGNLVKFIDLRGKDYRAILDFLKYYECGRRVIDTPDRYFFEDNFVWFKDNAKE